MTHAGRDRLVALKKAKKKPITQKQAILSKPVCLGFKPTPALDRGDPMLLINMIDDATPLHQPPQFNMHFSQAPATGTFLLCLDKQVSGPCAARPDDIS